MTTIRSFTQDLSGVSADHPDVALRFGGDDELPNGPVLIVEYPEATEDPSARDVWCEAQHTDWRSGSALAFRVKPDRAVKLSVSFIDPNHVVYTTWIDLDGGVWQPVRVDFDRLRPNPYFQPDDAKTGAPLDLSRIEAFAFAPHGEGSGRLAIGPFTLARSIGSERSPTALDLSRLWDFAHPDASEQRFRAALAHASGDDALILRTQIARTFGLRQQFDRARRLLEEIEPSVDAAGPEAQARFHLELGRTHASAAHPAEALTPEARTRARRSFDRALERSRAAGLDALAIDALHMLAFVDPAPADQVRWGEAALRIVLASHEPEVQAWEAALRHNVGYALHGLGNYDRALDEFERARAIRERGSNAEATHVARWMVAWTLRCLERSDEALAIQLDLEAASDAAGTPDPFVYRELEALFRSRGDVEKADLYASRATEARQG